jgi:hypothetical protein
MKNTIIFLLFVVGQLTLAQQTAKESNVPGQPNNQNELRIEISNALEKGNTAAASQMYDGFQAKLPADFQGSVFYEEIKACGFYPMETRLECVIEIKQPRGYAGPIGSPGSMEYVYFCVDSNNSGTFEPNEPVGEGIVQMHDESAGSRPPWHYAVYRDFNPFGGLRTSNTGNVTTTTTNGPTRKARAILSWNVAPTGCNFRPVWGNVVDFRIRFDPVR